MITEYIVSHQAEFWLVAGFAMLAIEVITGFTTGVFLFAGLGALTTGLLMSFGILPQTWIMGIACTGISAGIITTLLWRPLKRLQGDRPPTKDNSSDLVGHEFVVDSDIAANKPGSTHYSGIHWKVVLDKDAGVDVIQAGQRVSVSSVEVGVFKVRLAQ
ncbi:MAG: NfeD family protein [Gammaproteobacteria bacterium]|nr:NfeD family protein [Gammaproteobacteria bacterium]